MAIIAAGGVLNVYCNATSCDLEDNYVYGFSWHLRRAEKIHAVLLQ